MNGYSILDFRILIWSLFTRLCSWFGRTRKSDYAGGYRFLTRITKAIIKQYSSCGTPFHNNYDYTVLEILRQLVNVITIPSKISLKAKINSGADRSSASIKDHGSHSISIMEISILLKASDRRRFFLPLVFDLDYLWNCWEHLQLTQFPNLCIVLWNDIPQMFYPIPHSYAFAKLTSRS